MKKQLIKLTIIACLMILPALTSQIYAQNPPTPPSNQGTSGDAAAGNGGAAPLDGGLSILVLMAAAYGGKKIQVLRKK